MPPELTAAPADSVDVTLLAGAELEPLPERGRMTNFILTHWTIPPGTEATMSVNGWGLIAALRGEVLLFDPEQSNDYVVDTDTPLLLTDFDGSTYTIRNDSTQCVSLYTLKVFILIGAGGGGGGTFTDEDGPQLSAETSCGSEVYEHLIVDWQYPFGTGAQVIDEVGSSPQYLFIARKTYQSDQSVGRHSFTGPVGMYVEDGALWLPGPEGGYSTILGPASLTLLPPGRATIERTGPSVGATVLMFGLVSSDSTPGLPLSVPADNPGFSDLGNGYRTLDHAFSLTWNYEWVVSSWNDNIITLTNGVSTATFDATNASGDSQSCTTDSVEKITQRDPDNDYALARDDNGNKIAGPTMDGDGYFAIYLSPTEQPVYYIECIAFANGQAMVAMTFKVNRDDYASQTSSLNELRSRIRFGD